jgi:predicted phosphodiesterase
MRIALISDIHGNYLALEHVLADARRSGADQIACLGDVATLGPRPRDVLRALRDLGCPCILGNHDAFLLDRALVARYTKAPVIVDAIDWCRSQLSADDLAFVGTFAPELELPLSGGRRLHLFHGSPDSNMQDVLTTTGEDELERLLGARRADVMAGGHTHIQMLRQHRGTWVVNPGSVGMPFRQYVAGARPEIMAHAEYAIVDDGGATIAVELRRVALDRAALREQTKAWSAPPELLRDDLLLQYA